MKMKHSVTKLALLAAACGGMAFSGSAQAASILNLLRPGKNHFSDETAQGYATDVPNNGDPLGVGDILRGYVAFNSLDNSSFPVPGTALGAGGNEQLTGVFRIKVLTDTANADGSHTYTFGPDANWNFAASTLNTNGNSSGAMVLLFSDSGTNADFSSQSTASATATDGNLFLAAGFTGANGTAEGGQGWTATGDPDFSDAQDLNSGVQVATANFALDRVSTQGVAGTITLEDQIAQLFGGGPAELIGSSTIRGGADLNHDDFDAGGNSDFTIVTPVPTPAALGMGLALMGFMGARRRRRQA